MNNDHRFQSDASTVNLNTILCTEGFANRLPTRFLLDSGAAISVVRLRSLSEEDQQTIIKTESSAVSANGTPLDIGGQVKLVVSIGSFTCEHIFIVIRDLTVDCLLGADFLRKHGAVIDCKNSTLSLGKHVVPIHTGQQIMPLHTNPVESVSVIVTSTQEIPGRTVQLLTCKVKGDIIGSREGLIEPSDAIGGLPKYLCVARSLTTITPGNKVILQVMNISPSPIKVYKGMTLGQIISKQNILVVEQDDITIQSSHDYTPEINLDSSTLLPAEKTKLRDLLTVYSDIFATSGTPATQNQVVKHNIKTTGPPIRQPLRKMPMILKDTIDKEVTKMLQQGIVQPSTSPWSSPVVRVKKRDGTWRFCIDYRKLNAVTHQDAYPLPRIDETLDSLAGSTYFTTLDLAAGYWQVGIEECDKEKTAFSTRRGHFEFNVMPFGLTNAPATFQRLMECVLAGLTGEQCLIYLDDIIVFSSTFEEHLRRLANVFAALREAGLKLKPSKCFFAQKEVHYLGHVISAAGVSPDPAKTEVVSLYPIPTDLKQLRQFLGLANYYRRFVPDFSKIAEPLHKLLRKGATYNWNTACQEAFTELKHRLVTPPVVTYPDFKLPFLLYTDASDFALGEFLVKSRMGKNEWLVTGVDSSLSLNVDIPPHREKH